MREALPCTKETLEYRDRVRRFEDEADAFLRGVVATRVYRDQPDLPVVRKRAEVTARALEALAPVVLPEERFLGAVHRQRRVHWGVSDADWWRNQVAHPERHGYNEQWPLPEDVRAELRWWRGRAQWLTPNQARERHRWLMRYGVAHPNGGVGGHTLPDHAILLTHGIAGLRTRIAGRLAEESAPARQDELRAMDRLLEGLQVYCLRCADAGRAKAAEVTSPRHRRQLLEAAAMCERLAEHPPHTFPEALQLIWLSNFTDLLDSPGDATSYGRIDQLLAPYYEADLAAGRLTREEAFGWLCSFLVKIWCVQSSINLTLGGVHTDGADATNDLSLLFLEAMEATEMTTDFSVRLHQGTPPDYLRTVARVVRRGFGRPSLYNDEVTILALVAKGVALEDARDYAPLGCVEVMIPGRTAARTMCMGLNLPKVLELVLNGGRCLVTGETVWEDVPEVFPDFKALLAHTHARVCQVVDAGVEVVNEDEALEPQVYPRPWLTLLSRGGIEAAVDMTAGQPRYDGVGVTLDGVGDIANSLYAVRRLVFEEKRLSLEVLRHVLRANWEGHEALRHEVLHVFPRHGQDHPEINALVRQETDHFAACFEEHRTLYGGRFWPMVFGVATSMIAGTGRKTGATPSGRRLGEHLSMSLQPSMAGAQGCLTAVLNSAAAMDTTRYPGGISNVQECDPSHFQGEQGLDLLVALIRGFFAAGGMELSLNFLDEATLRRAQADPERYRALMVRVFGMSAQFVNLSPAIQESVVERVAVAGHRPC